MARLAAAIAICCLMAVAAGCGGGDGGRETRLESAIATAGEGASPTGTGVGWIDLDAISPADLPWAAKALAPEASEVLADHVRVARTTGFDPATASRALSLAGSYAFGVRFDEVGPGRLANELVAAGATEAADGDWREFDIGNQFVGQRTGPLMPLGALSSRAATAGDAVLLARADQARDSLTASEGGAISEGRLDTAAECLGDVDVARIVPGAFTHNQRAAPASIAFGVGPVSDDGTRDEVLCAIDLPTSEVPDRAALMERALAPGAKDAVTGEPMSGLVASVEVTTGDGQDDETVTRAAITRPPGAPPGLLLRAFPRGSLLTYLGSPAPGAGG